MATPLARQPARLLGRSCGNAASRTSNPGRPADDAGSSRMSLQLRPALTVDILPQSRLAPRHLAAAASPPGRVAVWGGGDGWRSSRGLRCRLAHAQDDGGSRWVQSRNAKGAPVQELLRRRHAAGAAASGGASAGAPGLDALSIVQLTCLAGGFILCWTQKGWQDGSPLACTSAGGWWLAATLAVVRSLSRTAPPVQDVSMSHNDASFTYPSCSWTGTVHDLSVQGRHAGRMATAATATSAAAENSLLCWVV